MASDRERHQGIAGRRVMPCSAWTNWGSWMSKRPGKVAYMLANGQGKGRSKQDGEVEGAQGVALAVSLHW